MIKMYGATWCKDCASSKNYLGEHKIHFEYVDIDKDETAAEAVKKLTNGLAVVPTFLFEDGTILAEPSNEQLAAKLGLKDTDKSHYTDLIVIGAGPAGLTAAIYTTREGVNTELFERKAPGGQAAVTDRIENYPGFPNGVSGMELAENMRKQAEEFGAVLRTGVEVRKILDGDKYKTVVTSEGNFYGSAVLLALGTEYKKLNVPGESENIGRGIHFCATCDGPFFRNKEVIVVGGGNSAMQEGLFLTRFAAKVTIVAWDSKLTGSEFLIEKVLKEPKITVNYSLNTTKVERKDNKMHLFATDRNSNTEKGFSADGIFVFIGLKPNTEFLKESGIELDKRGFIVTDQTLQTNIKGVFAAGDCRSGSTLQIASAVGEGAVAALMIREFLKKK